MDWKGRRVLVTGGCSFIGAHLVDALVARQCHVRVIDDLSSGKQENIKQHTEEGRVNFVQGNLLESGQALRAVEDIEIVVHLAAAHGGRGYVETHQAACASNLALDGMLFHACLKSGVQKVVYASSGCVYPNYLQTNPEEVLFLSEDKVGPPFDADNMYGWAKLMGEMSLRAYFRDFGLKSAALRYFTVFGPRGQENHAIIAMIARAFLKQDPFEVWGDGRQVRNWTFVSDIVEGTILAAEKIEDATAVNLGTEERVRVMDAVREVMCYTGHQARVQFLPQMPTGPLNRAADNSLARKLLGWEPRVKFIEGLHQTIDWYFSSKEREEVRTSLDRLLMER